MATFMSRLVEVAERVNYVPYIQSDGSQWLDTLYKPTNNTRVVLDAENLNNKLTVLLGYYLSTSNQYAILFYSSTGKYRAWFGSASVEIGDSSVVYSGRKLFTLDSSAFKVDASSVAVSGGSFTSTYNLHLFGLHESNTTNYLASMRLYSCQIYEGSTLVRDFWPCYDSDGVLCLYDKVEKKYYYNAGTGDFIAGEAA